MDQFDFYKILNVEKNVSMDGIKKSYKKLVLKYHPDKNNDPTAPDMFKKIQIAYETLSDKEKRLKYDAFDSMDNPSSIKNIFMCYQELIIDICKKYELNNLEKEEIIALFDPNDYINEINCNDMSEANKKLTDRVLQYIPKFMINKIYQSYPFLESTINFCCNIFH